MSHSLAEERCPVADHTLAELYRSHQQGLVSLVQTVSPDVRALLALYCYRRAHLQSLGLAIATTCSEDELLEAGGIAGAALYGHARKAAAAAPASNGRHKITLSRGPLTALAPLDFDDETEEA